MTLLLNVKPELRVRKLTLSLRKETPVIIETKLEKIQRIQATLLKPVTSKIHVSRADKYDYVNLIVSYFLKKKRELYTGSVILREEKVKNESIVKSWYEKITKHELEVDGDDTTCLEKVYKELSDTDCVKTLIDEVFNGPADIKKYYTQTMSGVYKYYFTKRNEIKIDNKTIKDIQVRVWKWKDEDAVRTYQCFLLKVYMHFRPDSLKEFKHTQEYYKYNWYSYHNGGGIPHIKKEVIENSMLLRSVMMDGWDLFSDLMKRLEVDSNLVINTNEFYSTLESLGAETKSYFADKDLDDVLTEAQERFLKEKV